MRKRNRLTMRLGALEEVLEHRTSRPSPVYLIFPGTVDGVHSFGPMVAGPGVLLCDAEASAWIADNKAADANH